MLALTTRIVSVVTALALVACGGTDVSGAWTGTAFVGGGNVSFKLTLDQSDDNVTGSGNLTGPVTSVAFTLTGTAKDDDVALMIKSSGFSDASYQATLDGDTMSGTWTEPGLTTALTLNR